jgi:hypothetical protein
MSRSVKLGIDDALGSAPPKRAEMVRSDWLVLVVGEHQVIGRRLAGAELHPELELR